MDELRFANQNVTQYENKNEQLEEDLELQRINIVTDMTLDS